MSFFECMKCGSLWALGPGDGFCPMCGAQIPFASVSLVNQPNLFADEPESAPLTLVVENVHGTPITVTRISDSHGCISAMNHFRPVPVQPGAKASIEVRYCRPQSVGGEEFPLPVTIKVLSKDGDVEREDACSIKIRPAPLVHGPEEAIMVAPASDGKIATKTVSCSFNAVAAELFRNATSANHTTWLQDVVADPKLQSLTLSIRTDQLTPGEEISGSVSINFDGHRPIQVALSVCLAPLQFMKTDYTLLVEQVRWIDMPIKNVSEKELEVRSVRIESVLKGDEPFTLDTDQFRIEHPTNLRIAPQQERVNQGDIRLRVDSFKLPPDKYGIDVAYQLGVSEGDLHVSLQVQVVAAEPDLGLLAIDFGTSNTCCAHINPAQDVSTLIPLNEANPTQKSIPSLIALRGIDEYLIGQDAKTITAESAALLKLKLGNDKPLLRGFSARELVFLFVREVIWKAERYLNRKMRILILTHPSRFTNREINDYRWIVVELRKVYPDLVCRLIDEASAAVLNFISDLNEKGNCSFFMFDFGGGTIDMTICDYIYSEMPKKIRLKNMGGLRRFGGQNINAIALDMVIEQFKDLLILQNPGQFSRNDIEVPYTPQAIEKLAREMNDEKLVDVFRTNLECYESKDLEDIKVALCKEDKPQDFGYSLCALIRTTRKIEKLIKTVRIDQHQFVAQVQGRIYHAVDTMKKIIRESPGSETLSVRSGESDIAPGAIILVGGSCRMSRPDMLNIMENNFHDSTIIRPERPDALKTCVVQGACLYGKQILLGTRIIDLIDFDGARSSFGYAALDDNFRTQFKAVVKKGCPLPSTSEFSRILDAGNVITLLENFGFDNVLENNPDIEIVDEFALDAGHHPILSGRNQELSRLTLTVNKDESILLEILVGDERISFGAKEREMIFTGR